MPFSLLRDPCALLLPKSQLSGRDSLIKAIGFNAGSSIAQRDIYLTAVGILVTRYECIQSGKPESKSDKASTASTAATKFAGDSVSVLQALGAESLDEPAHTLIGDLARVAGISDRAGSTTTAPQMPSRAAVLGAGSTAEAATSPRRCNCEHREWVYWPVVGGLALVVTSGRHAWKYALS